MRSSVAAVQGTLDALSIRAEMADAAIDITLRQTVPTLYNAGTGRFPFFGAHTYQYSLPAMRTTGSITLDGRRRGVEGSVWFDRQWFPKPPERVDFGWLGLSLDSGEYLSVWAETGRGRSWLTAVRQDGCHLVAPARVERGEGRWEVDAPALDAGLSVDFVEQDSQSGIYTGFCKVAGTVRGTATEGFGFTDIVG